MIIYDRAAMEAALPKGTHDSCDVETSSPSLPVEEEARARIIRGILSDPRGNVRPGLYATLADATRLRAALTTFPHFEAVTGLLERALIQSARTGRPLRFPPILAVSRPGQGKSLYCQRVAAALDTTCISISMPQTSDRGGLGGLATVWRGASIGRLAHGLIVASNTASPLFCIEEIDKPASLNGDDPTETLLNALEPTNAAAFRDEYLQVACNLSGALWIANGNDASKLSGPLADRFVVIDIPPPDAAQARLIVEAIANEPITEAGLIGVEDDAIASLAELSPRQMRLAIEIACGFAVSESRGVIAGSDVIAALKLVCGDGRRRQIGFMR